MADAIIYDLLKQMASLITKELKEEIKLIVGVDKEVKKLKVNMEIIKAVLDDAEERLVTQRAEKLWLKQLKNAYYDMDDVLDDWNTARIKSEIKKEEHINNALAVKKKKKVLCSFPSPSFCCHHVKNIALRHDIAHKIKKLNETLDNIAKSRLLSGFDLTRQLEVIEQSKTISFVDVSCIIGRDKHRDDLLSNLLGEGSQEERKPRVISLVGMSGIGKTTLAKQAYNNPKVKAHFELRMWVCVSDPFDQHRVAEAIYKKLTLKLEDYNSYLDLSLLSFFISDKKFLLVLDDVWTEDSTLWEPFKLALKDGAHGSRILVTTHKQGVAEMMGSAPIINLEALSDEDCWLIFRKIAFSNEDQNKDLEDIGRQLAIKCIGLPLAAKTLGCLMHNKRSREQWNNILDSTLWKLEKFKKGFLAPLLLSYYELPSAMKYCFSYCAVYPKDYLFSRDQLVVEWIAQGYIESNANVEMEIIGEKYFEYLAIQSFFQDFEKDEDNGKIIGCKMHDIVHDFAQSITRNECFQINGDKKLEIDCESARHLHLKISKESNFSEVYNSKNSRTLFLSSNERDFDFDMLLSNLFQHFTCLRTLNLDCPINRLPEVVENLKHLRCLLMNERVEIKELPETICNLCNLQTLSIKNCDGLMKLPDGMGKLINLRNLSVSNIEFAWHLPVFPKGIGKLISLRTLCDFNVKGCKLGELKNLIHLQVLHINGLKKVVDVVEAKNAQLKKKIHLRDLALVFRRIYKSMDSHDSVRKDYVRMKNDELILNALEPNPNLEILSIVGYWGRVYPNWMMSLTKLKTLQISLFGNLECLPPLGKLPFLESLEIEYVNNLQMVGVEFLGIESSKNKKEDEIIIIFPKLKSLKFNHLYSWEEWIGIGGMREEEDNGCVTIIMPRLHQLVIQGCHNLKSLPDFLRSTPLKELEIHHCRILSERCQSGTGGEEWPKISHIPNIRIIPSLTFRDNLSHMDEEVEDGAA